MSMPLYGGVQALYAPLPVPALPGGVLLEAGDVAVERQRQSAVMHEDGAGLTVTATTASTASEPEINVSLPGGFGFKGLGRPDARRFCLLV